MPACHIWDLFEAPLAAAGEARSKLDRGWALCPLSQPYGAPCGTGLYAHALVGPNGELCRVTQRSVDQLEAPCLGPVLVLDTEVLALAVPYTEKDLARAAGARWLASARKWCVKPGDTAAVQQWLSAGAERVSLLST